MWQDLVMSGVFIIFIPTFIPQILDCYYKKTKLNKISAGVTVAGLTIVSVCLWTLNTPFAAILEMGTAFCWLLCLYFSWWRK